MLLMFDIMHNLKRGLFFAKSFFKCFFLTRLSFSLIGFSTGTIFRLTCQMLQFALAVHH